MPNRVFKGQWDAAAIAAVVLLALSFAFGGASREHVLRLAVIELAALPLPPQVPLPQKPAPVHPGVN